MAYGYRRSSHRGYPKPTRVHGRGMRTKRVPVPRLKPKSTKRYVRKNAMQINRLSYSVNKLKAAAFGQKQFFRQIVRSSTGLPLNQLARISANFPCAFLHQAIGVNTPIWQVSLQPITGAVEVTQTGAFVAQPFPLEALDATSDKFDQLKYCQPNSLGVQPGYLHLSTSYEMLFTAVNWTGWVEVVQVTQRKTYGRQATAGAVVTDDFQMPSGLPGFANSCLGTGGLQYSSAPWMYQTKVLKRMYFNCAPGTPPTELLHTNNQKACRIVIKNDKFRSHIRAQKAVTDPQPIFHPDIPFNQQDWILFRASNSASQTAASHIAINVTRTPVFRDSVGSS